MCHTPDPQRGILTLCATLRFSLRRAHLQTVVRGLDYTVPVETLRHCCLMSHQAGLQQGCGVSSSRCSPVLYGVRCRHPTTVTLTHSTALMKTEMSLVPGPLSPLPCDPVALCLEASVHRTDPAGHSGPGPQIKEGCAPSPRIPSPEMQPSEN